MISFHYSAIRILFATLLLSANVQPLAAQESASGSGSAPAGETAPPTIAEVEAARQRGNFVFVRKGLKTLAEQEGSGLTQNSAPAATLLARVLLSRT